MPGILAGIIVGLITVLLAARSPAKKASRVSPVTAVNGNTDMVQGIQKAANINVCRIETALGIQHALHRKKNFLLMTCSFALSIILFLSFYASTAFMHHAITPLRPYTPDLSIVSPDSSCSLDSGLAAKLAGCPGVKRVYGRAFAYDVPARIREQEQTIMLFSYDLQQFNWAEEADYLLEGDLSKMIEEGNYVLAVHDAGGQSLKTGEVIHTDLGDLTVAGILSHCPIDGVQGTERLICSEDTFRRLTGESGYTILDMQLTRHASDEDVNRIRSLAGDKILFSDQRLSNQDNRGAFWAFSLFLYGFLMVIVLITCFHIVNSISMSASSRMRQYGSMRAIGMSCGQFTRMLAAETGAYAFSGCAIGYLLYQYLVTARWGTPYEIPFGALGLIVLVVLAASAAAVLRPGRQIRRMDITEVIHFQ